MKRLIPFLFVGCLMFIFSCKQPQEAVDLNNRPSPTATNTNFKTQVGQKIPQFSFDAMDGKQYSISDLEGKVVWLNFFATWCGPCIREMPHLSELHQAHQGKDFVILSLGRDHQINDLKDFVSKHEMEWMVGADPGKNIFLQFADKSIPRNYIIGKDGKIKAQEIGYSEDIFQGLKDKVEELL